MRKKTVHSKEYYEKQNRKLEQYKRWRGQGKSYQEIADIVGLSKKSVAKYCQKHDLHYSDDEMRKSQRGIQFKPSVDWAQRITDIYKGQAIFEHVERAKDGESIVFVVCSKCGTKKSLCSSTLRHPKGWRCDNCYQLQIEASREYKERQKQLDREEAKRERWLNRPHEQLSLPTCLKCGMIVTKVHTLCETCRHEAKKENYRRKDIRRRSRLLDVIRDKDITLKKLYDRDNGICYLCGKTCDFNDSKYVNGAFIVGNNYPTVEHIKPISLGGSDTWDNIKLACLYCNSKKGNREAV